MRMTTDGMVVPPPDGDGHRLWRWSLLGTQTSSAYCSGISCLLSSAAFSASEAVASTVSSASADAASWRLHRLAAVKYGTAVGEIGAFPCSPDVLALAK